MTDSKNNDTSHGAKLAYQEPVFWTEVYLICDLHAQVPKQLTRAYTLYVMPFCKTVSPDAQPAAVLDDELVAC